MAAKKNSVVFDILANTKDYAEGMSSTVKTTDIATKAMKIGFVALSAAIVGSTVAFAKFETGMANISTIIDTSTESVKDIGSNILKLSKEIPKPISEMVESMYDIRSAGIAASESMETLKSAGILATVGLSTTSEATDILTTSMNLYKSEGKSATEISNILFKTVKFGKNTIAELAQGFGSTAPLAKEAGVGIAEFSAATAALTAIGIPASVAQNNIKAAMVALKKETASLKKVFKALGVKDYKDLMKSSDNLGHAFTRIKDAAAALGIPLEKVTGRVEGANAITVIATSGAEVYAKALAEMTSGSDAVTEAFEKQNKTLTAQFQLIKNVSNATLIQLGSKLQPALIGISGSVQDVFKDLGEAINKNGPEIESAFKFIVDTLAVGFNAVKNISIAFVKLFDVLGGNIVLQTMAVILRVVFEALNVIGVVFKTVTAAAQNLYEDLGLVGDSLKFVSLIAVGFIGLGFAKAILGVVTSTKLWAISMKLLNFVMSANPIFLITSAVIALGLVIYDVITNFNEWKLAFNSFVNSAIIGWKKAKAIFTSGETKAAIEKEIEALQNENAVIDAQTDALKKRKDELKSQGKNSLDADRQAGEELETGKLKVVDPVQAEKDRQKALTDAANKGNQDRLVSESDAAVESALKKQEQNELDVERNEIWYQERIAKEEERYLEAQALLEEKRANGQITEEEFLLSKEELEKKHYAKLQAQEDQYNKVKNAKTKKQDTFMFTARKKANDAVVSMQDGMYSELKDVLRMAAADSKAAAIAYQAISAGEALVSTYLGAAKAFGSSIPFPGNIAAAALITAKGLLTVNAIRNQSFAVGTDFITEDMTANVHKGEGIIPAKENQFLQSGKLALVSSNFANQNNNDAILGAVNKLIEIIGEKETSEIVIGMKDDAIDFIEAEIVKRNAIGVNTL